ncbi:MAG: dTMP kinase [Thermoanaerobacteraceae bacterium]
MIGKLITFEGIDGCGKTTQIKKLEEYLIFKGYNILLLREPGGTSVGEKIRDILLNKKNNIADITEAFLYASSRAQLVDERILPELSAGKIVIMDRFVDSSYVYQGYARGLGIETVKAINDIATKKLIPDKTIYIDITPEESAKRITKRETDRLENEGIVFQRKVYEGYKKIIESQLERFIIINGMQDREKVHQDIVKAIQIIL